MGQPLPEFERPGIAALRIGLRSVRANAVPMVVLWLLAVAFCLAADAVEITEEVFRFRGVDRDLPWKGYWSALAEVKGGDGSVAPRATRANAAAGRMHARRADLAGARDTFPPPVVNSIIFMWRSIAHPARNLQNVICGNLQNADCHFGVFRLYYAPHPQRGTCSTEAIIEKDKQ